MKLLLLVIGITFSTQAADFLSFADIMLKKEAKGLEKNKSDLFSIDALREELEQLNGEISSAIKGRINAIIKGNPSELRGKLHSDICRDLLLTSLYLSRNSYGHDISPKRLAHNIESALYGEFFQRMNEINVSYGASYSLVDPAMAQLHLLKNALSLEYSFERSVGLDRGRGFEREYGKILSNLDLFIGVDGQWNKLDQVYRDFETKYAPAHIDSRMVKSQTLMAFIDNGWNTNLASYNFQMRLAYSIMKAHVKGKLKNIYRDIYFYFSGDGSQLKKYEYMDKEKSSMGHYVSYVNQDTFIHPGSHFFIQPKERELMEVTYVRDLLALERDKSMSNIDFFWQAHGGDSPLHGGEESLIAKELLESPPEKIRFINNTWCGGSEIYQKRFVEILEWAKYSPGAGPINNPFPFNFSVNFFNGLNIPVSLSEVLSRLTQEVFYHQLGQLITRNSENYVEFKGSLYTYSSWFFRHGENNFALADGGIDSNHLFNVTDSYVLAATEENDQLFEDDQKLYPVTAFQKKIISMFGSIGLSAVGFDVEEIFGEESEGYSLKTKSLNQFLRKFVSALNTTLLIMTNRDVVKSKYSSWDVFPLSDETILEFKKSALAKDLNENSDDIFLLQRYFVSKLKDVTIRSHRTRTQVRLDVSFDKPIAGHSPFLSQKTSGIMKGFDVSKNVQIDLTLVGANRISIKMRGVKIISTFSAAIEIPEFIVNHETGQWQLLKSGIPLFTLDLR